MQDIKMTHHRFSLQTKLLVVVVVGLLVGSGVVLFPLRFAAIVILVPAAMCTLYIAYLWPEFFLALSLWTYFLKFTFIGSIAGLGITPFMVLHILTISAYGLRFLTGKQRVVLPVGAAFFFLFIITSTFSLLIARDLEAALGLFFRTALDWILVLVLIQVFTDRRKFQRLLMVLLIQACIYIYWGMATALLARASGAVSFTGYESFFWNQLRKNDYVIYLAFAGLLSTAILMHERHRFRRVLAYLILIAAPVAWFLTRSRSGLVTIAISVIIFLVLERNTRLLRVLAVIGLIAGGSFAVFPSQERDMVLDGFRAIVAPETVVYERNIYTIDLRLELMNAGLEVLSDHPLLGIGFNQWQFYSPLGNYRRDARTGEQIFVPLEIHNRHLQLATNSGLLSLFAYFGFVVVLLLNAWNSRPEKQCLIRTMLNAMIAFVIAGQLTMTVVTGYQWEWPALGILAGLIYLSQNESGKGA
jgi:O-antigen ligase